MPNDDSRRILISVLNWNGAEETARCLASLAALRCDSGVTLTVVVLDNGSTQERFEASAVVMPTLPFEVEYSPINLGFAGGHNRQIRRAIDEGYDFIWVLNNDSVVEPDALMPLVRHMREHAACAVTSPVIVACDDAAAFDFCGAAVDWTSLSSVRASSVDEGLKLMAANPSTAWLAGTALFIRVSALLEIGVLDERLFAYYEDNDFGMRVARSAWTQTLVPDSRIAHNRHRDAYEDRGAHYFYLMTRNAFVFWHRYTPSAQRRWLRYRLIGRAFLEANSLRRRGQHHKADACLHGVRDGLLQRGGPPALNSRPGLLLRLLSRHFGYGLHAAIEARSRHDS